MTEKIDRIEIVPAVYAGVREDGNVLLKCLAEDDEGNDGVVARAFEPRIFKGMENLKYILLGIKISGNTMILTVTDGTEFENLYHEKWNVLLK